ncbi:MAG: hypothetical protein ACOC1K_05425 [Nanoarchaeota archaeon]
MVKKTKYRTLSKEKMQKLKQKAKRTGKPIILGKTKQRGPQNKSGYSKKSDRKKKALPPGKRISKTGKVYYEYRRDHSDKSFRRI